MTEETEDKKYSIPTVPNKAIEIYKKELADIVQTAKLFIVASDKDREDLNDIGKKARARVKFFEALFDDGVKKAKALHTSLCDDRSAFTGPYGKIYDIARVKIGAYDKEVADKKAEEDAKKRQIEVDAHNRRIIAARKKTENLLSGITDLTQQLAVLNNQLENGEFNEDEAEVMREQISLLERAIENKKEKVETVAIKVEDKAPVSVAAVSQAKPSDYEITVTDPAKLIRAIAEGAPVGLVKDWNIILLKQLKKSGMEYPGVSYKPLYTKTRL